MSLRFSVNAEVKKDRTPVVGPQVLVTIIVLLIILAGFCIRLLYLMHKQYHPDEYISMLAARSVAERGIPILPSGLFYNTELSFSYFSGLLMWWMGASEFTARWAGLFFGVLVIPMAYTVGRRIFSSPLVGVMAATLFAFAPEIVLWGSRARRYSMMQFFILLMLWLIWVGAIHGDRRKFRLLFYSISVLAGLSGILALMVFPPLALAVVILTWRKYAPRGIPRRDIFIEMGLFALIFVVFMWFARYDFVAQRARNWQARQPHDGQNSSLLVETLISVSPFLVSEVSLSTEFDKIQEIAGDQPFYIILSGAGLSVALLCLVLRSSELDKLRKASWFMVIITFGVAFEFLFLVSEGWKSIRYLFGSFWPLLAILASGVIGWLQWFTQQQSSPKKIPASNKLSLVPIILITIIGLSFVLPETLNGLSDDLKEDNSYYQSFQYVARHRRTQDKVTVTTIMPPMSYWYLGRVDYYFRPKSYVFRNSEGKIVDVWTGALWIYETKDLEKVFADGQPVWLIIDERRLYEQLPLGFRQQVFARMELVFEADEIKIYYSVSDPHPIPFEPEIHLETQMDRVELTGYALDEEALRAGRPAQLTLFWKVIKPLPVPQAKVFVHLRDSANQTVAQADHIPSDILVPIPMNTWRVGEVIPDVSYLTLPVDIPPGEYKLLVGIYDPKTGERLPVQNDITGENAVVLNVFQVP